MLALVAEDGGKTKKQVEKTIISKNGFNKQYKNTHTYEEI